jgi:hypothetical protein
MNNAAHTAQACANFKNTDRSLPVSDRDRGPDAA